jgi:hypothetical protein
LNDWQGKPKYSEKTCPNGALSTTNPDANPGSRGWKPAANRLSYGTVFDLDLTVLEQRIRIVELSIFLNYRVTAKY